MPSSAPPLVARLSADLWIHATARRATLHRTAIEPRAAARTASEGATRRLLDGALAAVWNVRVRTLPAPPPLTPTRWIWRLVGYYHLTHSTPTLLTAAAESFARAGRASLAAWAETRAREEDHHDRLACRDLRALGVDPPHAIARLRPHPTEALVAWFRSTATAPDPIACVGYAYVVERLAMATTADDLRRVDACLPPGVRATRCMRVHSAVGSDADHVADTVTMVARLSAPERSAVARAVYEAAGVCTEPPAHGPPTDAWIEARLGSDRSLHPSRPPTGQSPTKQEH